MPAASRPLILVDGSAYLFRAFHAMERQGREFSTASGQRTETVKVVLNMLRKLVITYRPELMAVVFDAKGKTFRDDLYPEYKATRSAMPDPLRSQIAPLHTLVDALGMPLLVIEGVEADDVIGTLCREASESGIPTIVSTGDKDMAQLVNEHVTLVNTMTDTVMDPDGVIEKFGVRADQIADYLALVGDTVDNIPGVASCGPKTAAKWLAAHGDLDTIIANADSVKGKIGEKLRDALDTLPLSRTLTTIKTDVELPQPVAELCLRAPDIEHLASLYDLYEFRGWRDEINAGYSPLTGEPDGLFASGEARGEARGGASGGARGGAPSGAMAGASLASASANYEIIRDQAALDGWLQRLVSAELFAFDTETTSLDYMQAEIVGLSFAIEAGSAAYVPLAHVQMRAQSDEPASESTNESTKESDKDIEWDAVENQLDRDAVLAAFKPLLERTDTNLVGQHLKYDANVLRRYGIELNNIAHDTMLESYVLDSTGTRHDMDSLARKYLGVSTVKYEDVAGKGKKQLRFDQVPLEAAAHYAAEDADITLQLHQKIYPQLEAEPALLALYTDIEIPASRVLSRIECTGVRIDTEMLRVQGAKLAHTIEETKQEAWKEAGKEFNLGSPKQIQAIFFDELQLPVIRKTPKGQPSTAEDVLEQLAVDYRLPSLILRHRSLTKLMSTYIEKLPGQVDADTGRVHTSYNQAVASTGRLSSTDPNLQNIPVRTEEGRRIREAFVAADGYRLLAADYSQIELRIMAHLSEDASLLHAFAEKLDVHRATAAEVFGVSLADVDDNQRRSAKAINFGLIYGMSAFGLAKQLDIARGEAQEYIDLYFSRYPGVKTYMDDTRARAKDTGFVETVFGRRLYLPDINARAAQLRNYAERTAINAPMQGTAADIIKRAMIDVQSWLDKDGVDARIIMQVHDELVLEVPAGAGDDIGNTVAQIMTQAASLKVPLEVDYALGNSWEEAH
jgi:DNA polymerase-1